MHNKAGVKINQTALICVVTHCCSISANNNTPGGVGAVNGRRKKRGCWYRSDAGGQNMVNKFIH